MFRMSVQYELADIMALSKFHSRTEGKRRRIGELLFATLICAYEIYCIVVCVKYHAWSVPNIAVLILDALAIAYLALLPQISALIMWRRNKDLPAQEMRFDEKEMQIRGKNELFTMLVWRESGLSVSPSVVLWRAIPPPSAPFSLRRRDSPLKKYDPDASVRK